MSDPPERASSVRAGNKTSQYIKYAIGEITLVVLGILIALQINNWNEDKKEDKALKEYLVKIKSNTLEDRRALDSTIVLRRHLGDMCKKARRSILDKTEEQNLFLLMASGWAFTDFYFKPNTGGYESLKNSDYFGKINNTPLDSLLARYHSLLDEIEQNERSYNEYIIDQESYLSTQYDRSLILATAFIPDSLNMLAIPQSEYNTAYVEYTSSAPYRNVISLAAWQFDEMIVQYNKLKDVGHHVIAEIDAITDD